MLSIRSFLLINLLLCVTLITSLAIIGNLYLAHRDIQSHLDNQLINSAIRFERFFSQMTRPESLHKIQQLLNKTYLHKHSKEDVDVVQFQIWKRGQLILHSRSAPQKPLSKSRSGWSNNDINSVFWRVYSYHVPRSQLTVMVANKIAYRQVLENRLSRDSLYIMLLTYPLLGLLIWIIIGRGLKILKTITTEVRHRDPNNLTPVDRDMVPSEILPLIGELNGLFLRLKEAFSRYESFTADAAHELKTPLAALSAQTQVALRAKTATDRNHALLKVLGGVNRCTHVVQQLLILSRLVPEAGINDPVKIILAKQVGEIAAMLVPDAIARKVDLELLSPDSPAIITGNVTAINILIRNLIDNAIRYTRKDSFVQLDVEETDQHVILKVIDDGPGIPDDLKERVFQRFFRVVGNNTTGSGLGLSIVVQIVKLHQAEMQLLTPESGRGLEFQILFPKKLNPSLREPAQHSANIIKD